MRTLPLLLLVCALPALAQQPQPTENSTAVSQVASDYRPYSILLVGPPPKGDGVVMILTKDQRLVFTPTDKAKLAFDSGGVPIRYGDVLQLLQQLTDDNARLKAENERLWKIAENKSSSPSTVVVQTPSQPQPDQNAEARRQMQMMLLRSLMTPRPSNTVNVNVTDCSKYPALCVAH